MFNIDTFGIKLIKIVARSKMQKSQGDAQIIEKVPLKQKLNLKVPIKEKSEIMLAKFAHQDSLVACGTSDGYVRIYNLIRNNKIAEINTNVKDKETNSNTPVNALRWRPASEKLESVGAVLLAANTNGHLFQFLAKTGKQLWHAVETDNQIFALDYAHDGRYFATAGKENVIRIYDQETKKTSHNLKGELRSKTGHSNRIFSVKFKPDNHSLLVSGGWDQNVHIWDLRVGEVTYTIVGPRITGDAIDFRDDLILTGSSRFNDQLQLWDYRTTNPLHTYTWDQNSNLGKTFLNSCQFCPNSKNTVIAAGGQQMKMFTIDDHLQLLELRTPLNESIFSCDSSAINNKYIAGGKQGLLYYLASNKFAE